MGAKLDPLDVKSLGVKSEDIALREPKPCNHIFSYYKAGEIICRKCNAGLYIQADEHLEDGHLYKLGKRII